MYIRFGQLVLFSPVKEKAHALWLYKEDSNLPED